MNLSFFHHKFSILIIGLFLFFTSCKSKKKLTSQTTPKKIPTTVKEFIEGSEVFDKSFTGFALYDPKKKKMVYQSDADKYFTPASNAKILTLFTSLSTLGDSIPALKYIVKNDSLIFWGTGDPSFLHPQLADKQRIIDFLKNRKEKLFFASSNFMDGRFGAGWAWDDYSYSFQVEKSSFPIHGNVVLFQSKPDDKAIDITPNPFKSLVANTPEMGGSTARFKRREFENIFDYNQQAPPRNGLKKEIPFQYSHEFFVELLSLILEKDITLLDFHLIPSEDSKTIYSVPVDTIYEYMMQESDNFMAEQLLLMCSNEVFDTMNTHKIISHTIKNHFADLPDRPQWRDGSGLSRYNLFTPRSVVGILEKIYRAIPEERIFRIFPTGKKEGTIKNWYAPYVHAKTGTLSNRHCLSGYIKTKKGKTLIFSFMHNNYTTSSKPLKEEMEKILHFIHMNF